MALRVRRIKKAFGFDKTKTEKYVIVPDRATVVGFEAFAIKSLRSQVLI